MEQAREGIRVTGEADIDRDGAAPLSRTKLVATLVVGAIAFAILVTLGNWQMQRLEWKEAIIARVEERTRLPAVPAPPPEAWANFDFEAWEYRPVSLTGRFRHDREAYVYTLLSEPRGRFGGAGYWVMTPLEIAPDVFVVVNRGFVPVEAREASLRPQGQVEGEVTVTGLLRAPEERNYFTPEDEPDRALFYVRDPVAIGQGYGLAHAAPYSIDVAETAPGGLPQGGETRLVFTNRHLEYALTWYGLAATLLAVALAVALSRRKRRA